MYLQHFGLKDAPFSLTPDTEYFFGYRAHQEAINVLLLALDGGEGFIKVTGEVGTGKTLLCRQLLKLLGRVEEHVLSAYLPNSFLRPAELRLALADELGLQPPESGDQHHLLKSLTARLMDICAGGRRVVIIIDEAQAMPDDTLEALRLLSNLETEKEKLLSVILFAQPELDERLKGRQLRQLRQRIGFSYRLQPLDAQGVRDYLNHRLQVAGLRRRRPLFTPAAVSLIGRAGRGIPRLVNILAHKSLLAAYGKGAEQVEGAHARRAVMDTEDASSGGTLWFSRWLRTLAR